MGSDSSERDMQLLFAFARTCRAVAAECGVLAKITQKLVDFTASQSMSRFFFFFFFFLLLRLFLLLLQSNRLLYYLLHSTIKNLSVIFMHAISLCLSLIPHDGWFHFECVCELMYLIRWSYQGCDEQLADYAWLCICGGSVSA